MPDARTTIPPILLDWLSSEECPPVHYLAQRDLAPRKPSARALATLRRRALAWEPLQQILALQQPDGSFPGFGKAKSFEPTLYAICLMQRCGMDAGDKSAAHALAFVNRRLIDKGAYSYLGGGSGVLPCYVGVFTRAALGMAGAQDTGVAASLRWIVDHQRFDHKTTRGGGRKKWRYKAVDSHGGCWWSVSCYHGVAATYRALAAIPADARSNNVVARLRSAAAYLRIHRGYKRSRDDKALFRHLTKFFIFGAYRSHLVDLLEAIADADPSLASERWVQEMIATVDDLAPDGRIVLQQNYPTKLVDPLPFEGLGQPSRFLTLQWQSARARLLRGRCQRLGRR